MTTDTIAQVIHDFKTCTTIKQVKQLKPLWYAGWWLKNQYGEAWHYEQTHKPGRLIINSQTHQGKCRVLTMVKATTGWLETYPVFHGTAWNTTLGLEKQVRWWHSTLERTKSKNGTYFWNNLIDTWAKENGIEWVSCIVNLTIKWPGRMISNGALSNNRPLNKLNAHPLSYINLQENQTIQWTVKDYTESKRCWDIQALGYTFSKGHLVS